MQSNLAISIVLLLLSSCQKDKELITGEITGIISTYNQDFTLRPDQSGLQVSLYMDSALVDNTFTDSHGQYVFENVAYGTLYDWSSSPINVYGIINYWEWDLESLKSDTIYFCLYPLAFGQGNFGYFAKEALGKPSNVVGLVWEE